MRNQIRLMMGTLIDLGKGKLSLEDTLDLVYCQIALLKWTI